MESAFQYNHYVTGKQFIGRLAELKAFSDLVARGEHIVLYEPPKTGITSLIQQAFYTMRTAGEQFVTIPVSLLGIRSAEQLTLRLASCAILASGSTPDEYASAATELLAGTHLIYDEARYKADGAVISASWQLDDSDLQAVFLLPWRLGERSGIRHIVVLEEFQNVQLTEDGDHICRLLETLFKRIPEPLAGKAVYVFTGSSVNAMHEIFGVKRWLWRQVTRIQLPPLQTKELVEHVIRGFLVSGKVIDRGLASGACELLKNNVWYVNHLHAICDSLSRGYIMEQTLQQALSSLIAVHEPRFRATMSDLTTFQLSLLQAVLDGHTRFSSAEVIRRYGLNSSANVRRLKDALCKKEIITFDDNDDPVILDPLFEYWIRKYYFNPTLL